MNEDLQKMIDSHPKLLARIGAEFEDRFDNAVKPTGEYAARVALSAIAKHGFQIVPKEPTEAMLERAARALCVSEGEDPDKPIKSGQDGLGGMVTIFWQYYKRQAIEALKAALETP